MENKDKPFRFPDEYYSITTSNSTNPKKANWFCNKPLSPVGKKTDENIRIQEETEKNDRSEEGMPWSPESTKSNSIADPDYTPELSECSSDISSSSPQINCTPPDSSCFSGSERDFTSPDRLYLAPEYASPKNHSSSDIDGLNTVSLEPLDQYSKKDATIGEQEKVIESTKKSVTCDTVMPNEGALKQKKIVFCYYCESNVQHFPRHLVRNHKQEIEVQKLLTLPPGSIKRSQLLFALRKKGNYLKSNQITKPVRRGTDKTNYLPCQFCLGFYSSKNLWRHRKNCDANPDKNKATKNAKTLAQNFLLKNIRVNSKVRDEVFPRMRADRISFTAKKDRLICEFAARYLTIHREKHFVLVASRKMRELARLLLEIQKHKPFLTSLVEVLQPKYYDTLVCATKEISQYNSETQSFVAPTLAVNMGTTIKQCCDIALVNIFKETHSVQSATSEADLKTLIQLIKGNWKFDVSSQASSDLKLQKWNKISIVPLASDLKKLKDCLINKADSALLKLQNDNLDKQSYSILLETIYCRLILLNRRRPGELQRLFVETYKTAVNNVGHQQYEEFSEALTESEQLVMKNFKRIVLRGKMGRGVPVLIDKAVQNHLEVVLKCRDKIIKKSSPYLFGNPSTGQPIVGYKVLKKYAVLCNAKNPQALTCTRLRKHLATLTQLFNMSESDLEQLASFMGHTLGIHRSSYRLPDDVYQTARISKLLILMERGEAGQFKGKKLDEINLNLDENLMDETHGSNETEGKEEIEPNVFNTDFTEGEMEGNRKLEDIKVTEPEVSVLPKKAGSKRILVPWTPEQKKVVTAYFKPHIKEKRPPKKSECEDLISKNPKLLGNKNWLKIKVYIQNLYKKK